MENTRLELTLKIDGETVFAHASIDPEYWIERREESWVITLPSWVVSDNQKSDELVALSAYKEVDAKASEYIRGKAGCILFWCPSCCIECYGNYCTKCGGETRYADHCDKAETSVDGHSI